MTTTVDPMIGHIAISLWGVLKFELPADVAEDVARGLIVPGQPVPTLETVEALLAEAYRAEVYRAKVYRDAEALLAEARAVNDVWPYDIPASGDF